MYAFTFHRPTTVRQAAGLLTKHDDAKVLAGGHTERVPGTVSAPLAGRADAVEVCDLHAAPFFAGVLFTWRRTGVAERLAELLGDAERLGRMGGDDPLNVLEARDRRPSDRLDSVA